MLGPTILDICHLLGLPVDGEPVTPKIEEDPTFAPSKYDISYSSFIDKECKASTTVDDRELFCCILYWLCKFVFCTPSSRITSEFVPMAKALAQGRKLALAPYFLGHVYKVCSDLTFVPSNPNQGGTMWFLQVWILSYFKYLHHSITFFDQLHIRTYAEKYTDLTFEKDSFETYLQYFYSQPAEVPNKFFIPFDDISITTSWVRELLEAKSLSPTQSSTWLNILSAQEIFLGAFHSNYKKCSS